MTSWFVSKQIDARFDLGTKPVSSSVQLPVLISFDTTRDVHRTLCIVAVSCISFRWGEYVMIALPLRFPTRRQSRYGTVILCKQYGELTSQSRLVVYSENGRLHRQACALNRLLAQDMGSGCVVPRIKEHQQGSTRGGPDDKITPGQEPQTARRRGSCEIHDWNAFLDPWLAPFESSTTRPNRPTPPRGTAHWLTTGGSDV